MTKKTSAIVIISIIIIVISLAISIYIPNKRKIESKAEDNSISYYLLKKDENFGVINGSGDIIIEPEYQEIIIPNQHRAVFICNNEDKSKVLNDKNEEIFKKYSNVQAIELTNVISDSAYEKKVLKYEKNNKFGLLGIDGEVVVEAKYDEISSLEYKEGELLIKENNKYGVIDDKGYQIIKTNYDSISSDQYYCANDGYKKSGYIVCNVTNDGYRYGYYDYEGSKMLDTEYNQIIRLVEATNKNDIYLAAAKNGQYGIFINNNKIINTQYQSITYDPTMQIFIVERTGQYGAVNEKGIEILKTEYSDIQINGIYMYTQKGEERKIFDKTGKEVDIPINTIIQSTKNSDYYIRIEQNEVEEYSIINSNFEEILNQKYKYIEYLFDKYFIATNEAGKSGIIDVDGNIILEFNYDLIQTIKEKNIIQSINFETGVTELYNNELIKILEINNINIQTLDDYVKIYNDTEEYYLDNNGNKIEDEEKLQKIKESNAILRIKNYKRVTYGVEQYYYIEEN